MHKTKIYHFAPGVIERQPRRNFISRHGLLATAGLLTAAAVLIGWVLGGAL